MECYRMARNEMCIQRTQSIHERGYPHRADRDRHDHVYARVAVAVNADDRHGDSE